MFHPPSKVDSSVIRYFVSIAIIALGLWFGYEVVTVANSTARTASMGSAALTQVVSANGTVSLASHKTVCKAPKAAKVVEIYPGDPRLQLQLYTFGSDDLSVAVIAHASKKGRMAGSGLHKFYANHLCTAPSTAATNTTPATQASGSKATSASATSPASSTAAPSAAAAPAAGAANATSTVSEKPSRHRKHSLRFRSLASSKPASSTCKGIVSGRWRIHWHTGAGKASGGEALECWALGSVVLAKMGFDVHAFEPQAPAADLLKCSLLANHLHNLHITSEGISDAMGKECLIYPMAKLAHQAMLAPKAISQAGCEPTSEVPVVTLDHYWENVLDKAQISLIKIDAEGHEELIMAGGSRLFKEAPPPFVLVEYDPKPLSFKSSTAGSLLQEVEKAGYRVYDCQGRAEISLNDDGVAGLESYKVTNGKTWLLLVHKSKEQGPLPAYACDT